MAAKSPSEVGNWLRVVALAAGVLTAVAVSHVKICEPLTAVETNQRILMDIAYGKMKANANPDRNDRASAASFNGHAKLQVD